jgi:hypothetical protein
MFESTIANAMFGILFALGGLTLAIILGVVLYKDRRQESDSTEASLGVQEESSAA